MTPSTLVSRISCISDMGCSMRGPTLLTPALLIKTSMWPSSLMMVSTAAVMVDTLQTSRERVRMPLSAKSERDFGFLAVAMT